MKRNYNKRQEGYVTLVSVLIVGAVGMAAAVTLILLGLGHSRTSFALEQSYQAKALAGLCAEEALERIRILPGFTGLGGVNEGMGTCSYRVSDLGPLGEKLIEARGGVGIVVRYVEVNIDRVNPMINIVSWREVEFISGL